MSTFTKQTKSSSPTWTTTQSSNSPTVTIQAGSTYGMIMSLTYAQDIVIGGGAALWTTTLKS